jgi:ABC-type multidrug transport system fused ATPase/permease subunit
MSELKKFYLILSRYNITKFYLFIFLMIIVTLLELVGIGLLIPFINVLGNNNLDLITFLPSGIKKFLLGFSKKELFIFALYFFFILILIKLIFTILLNFYQNKYTFDIQVKLGTDLFKKYILNAFSSSYSKTNSSLILRNVTDEVHIFTEGVLLQGMTFVCELFIAISIIIFLIVINIISTLTIIIFVLFTVIIFFYLIKNKLSSWGSNRQYYGALRIQEVNQSIGSIKELKLYKKENYFSERFNTFCSIGARSAYLKNTVLSLPRISFEFLSITAISLIAFIMFNLNYNLSSVLQFIIVFSIAAFRLLPSTNRIINFMQQLSYHKSVVNLIYKEINLPDKKLENFKNIDLDFNDKILIKNITFKYDLDSKVILKEINFEIKKYQSIAIIGESGSGKSTLLNILLGFLEPLKGEIYLDGKNISANLESWQSKLGYVPQDVYLLDDTIANNVAYGVDKKDIDFEKVKQCIEKVFLKDFVSVLPKGLDTVVGERGSNISGGQKQRLGIARALYRNPDILLLDESTNSLDSDTEDKLIKDLLNIKKDLTIIFVTHKINILKNFDKVYEIKNSNIFEKKI